MSTAKKIWALVFSGALLASCADSPSRSSDNPADSELEKLTIGVLQVSASAPIPYGIEEGIFEKHGLDVEIADSQGGAAMLPAVEAGTFDIGVLSPISALIANDRGLDMRVVSGFSYAYPEGDDVNGVVVRKDSGIETINDLAHLDTAVNLLQTQSDLALLGAMENLGGDPDSLNFVEVPFPDMAVQLGQGNIDAAYLPYPFLSTALEDPENELLAYPLQHSVPGMPMFVSITSSEFADENPERVQKFYTALEEVMESANDNEEAIRKLLPDFMGLTPEAAESVLLDDWSAEIRNDLMDDMGASAIKYGFIDEMPTNLYID